MTDRVLLAARALERYAAGDHRDLWALSLVVSHVAGLTGRAALASGVPYASCTLAEAVGRLQREIDPE